MGREARLRKEKLKALILAKVEDWTRPATEAEATLLAEFERLPTITVERIEAGRSDWNGASAVPRQLWVTAVWRSYGKAFVPLGLN